MPTVEYMPQFGGYGYLEDYSYFDDNGSEVVAQRFVPSAPAGFNFGFSLVSAVPVSNSPLVSAMDSATKITNSTTGELSNAPYTQTITTTPTVNQTQTGATTETAISTPVLTDSENAVQTDAVVKQFGNSPDGQPVSYGDWRFLSTTENKYAFVIVAIAAVLILRGIAK